MGAFHDDRTSREINERAVDTARGPMGSSDEADELVSAKEVDEEDYEQERLLNIQRNRELLATLGIDKVRFHRILILLPTLSANVYQLASHQTN